MLRKQMTIWVGAGLLLAGAAVTLWAGSGTLCECFNNPQPGGGNGLSCGTYCDFDGMNAPCGTFPATCGFECVSVDPVIRQCYISTASKPTRSRWVWPGSRFCNTCKFRRCVGGQAIGCPLPMGPGSKPGNGCDGIG